MAEAAILPAVEASTAMILNLQRLSTEDGPGIRTTVFFKGCPLSCAWCHNPESIPRGFQIQWLKTRCIGCRTCLSVCPQSCLEFTPEGLAIDRGECSLCMACAQACPAGAMEQVGRAIGLEDLINELAKDRSFYETSGGGVTASGGEPTLQAGFVRELFNRMHSLGIHTALDTCGLARFEDLEGLLSFTDLVLYDLKAVDAGLHREFTGADNRLILENLQRLAAGAAADYPHLKIWLRTPLIPGATATAENVSAVAGFISENLAGRIERWELCAFNNLCRDKYRRLGLEWPFEKTPLLSSVEAESLRGAALACGLAPENVLVTGSLEQAD